MKFVYNLAGPKEYLYVLDKILHPSWKFVIQNGRPILWESRKYFFSPQNLIICKKMSSGIEDIFEHYVQDAIKNKLKLGVIRGCISISYV